MRLAITIHTGNYTYIRLTSVDFSAITLLRARINFDGNWRGSSRLLKHPGNSVIRASVEGRMDLGACESANHSDEAHENYYKLHPEKKLGICNYYVVYAIYASARACKNKAGSSLSETSTAPSVLPWSQCAFPAACSYSLG